MDKENKKTNRREVRAKTANILHILNNCKQDKTKQTKKENCWPLNM